MIFAAILIVIHLARPFDIVLVGFHIPLVACSLAVVAVVVAGGLRIFTTTGTGRIIAAILVWMLLISPFSIWKGGTADYLKTYILLMVVLFLAVAAGPGTLTELKRLMQILGFAVTLGVIVLSAVKKDIANDGPALDYRSGGIGTFGNEGEFALLIGFVLPFWVFTASTIKNRFIRLPLMAGGTAYLFVLLVLTGTRSAFIALIPAMLFLLWRLTMVQRLMMIAAGLIMVIGIIAAAPQKTLQRLAVLGLEDNVASALDAGGNAEAVASAQERKELLLDAIQTAVNNPIFGVGPGNFGMYRFTVLGASSHKTWFPAHNTYLQIAAECGIIGAILYLALIGNIFLVTRNAIKRFMRGTPESELANRMGLCLQVSLLFYAVMAAFQNCDHYPHVFVLAGMAVALDRVGRFVTPQAIHLSRLPWANAPTSPLSEVRRTNAVPRHYPTRRPNVFTE